MATTWIPVESCRLPAKEQPLRADEFDDLFRQHLVSVASGSSTRADLLLRGPEEERSSMLARVRDLVARESGCCSFFEFDVTEVGDGAVRLSVSVPEERAGVLSALTTRAETLIG